MKTAFEGARTAYNSVPTAYYPPAAPEGPAMAPEAAEAQAAPATIPDDKWGQVQAMADGTQKVCEIERELMVLFDKRQSLSRRLVDGAKRRDDKIVQESATAWMHSEALLAKAWGKYAPIVHGRMDTLRQLGIEP